MHPVHEKFLAQASEIALQSIKQGGGPFGAVVVRRGEVVAVGSNQVVLQNDPVAHAEIVAIRAACQALKSYKLTGCILYSSCEPCPMCLGAIYWAHLDAVWYASTRRDAARYGFSDLLIYNEIALEPSKRAISMGQIKTVGAEEVFKSWQTKSDKVEY